MKPPTPLPTTAPFLSIYTPTYKRPTALAACLASVGSQTAVDDIEHLVVPDHVGYGVADGLYGRMPWYGSVLRGRYVHVLCDDDVLADERVVADARAFAAAQHDPDVIVVKVVKHGMTLPACDPLGPPVCGAVDLCSYLVKGPVWHQHVHDYGRRYEGDFDHVQTLHATGYRFAFWDRVFVRGDARHGRPEA